MRQLYYTNYQSGRAGLSNGIMSIELGVVLAFLTNRFLLLEGNISPPANLVDYDGRVDNTLPSRITDLIDIPVPWAEPDKREVQQIQSRELTEYSLMDSMFYLPGTVDINSADALDFARGRNHWLCETGALAEVPLMRVSEQPIVPGGDMHRHNLSFYSYFFYLNDETRRSVYQLLTRMQARQPYAELAKRVAADLGTFNAAHLRRGDFKVTYGVTVLDRQPYEAIEAMERHFSRDERLLICTDERDDPFFNEIKDTWTDHVFIDHHILDHYGREFSALPRHDSIALAYLSQLVTAESADFIGSMTSTFTAIIQRLRGNRDKKEEFKFLWNELPDPGERFERGRHPISECVPLEDGVMVPEYEGCYSWNRYNHRLNPAWMREWPESFLTEQVLKSGSLRNDADASRHSSFTTTGKTEDALIYYEGLGIRISSKTPGLAFKIAEMLYRDPAGAKGRVFTEIEIQAQGGGFFMRSQGGVFARVQKERDVPGALLDYLVPILARSRKSNAWFQGKVFRRAGRSMLYVGDPGQQAHSVADALCMTGWELLADTAVPVHPESCAVIPFARCTWPKGAAARIEKQRSQLTAVVYGVEQLHNRGSVIQLSPSMAVAELTNASYDFRLDRERAMKFLCTIAEQLPMYQLAFSRADEAAQSLEFLTQLDMPADIDNLQVASQS